jgi:serine/threonine-protein kinase
MATVPQLVGLTSLEAARVALADANLQLGSITEEDSNQPPGYVLAQEPAEGTQLGAGSPVAVTVSSGLVTVPTLVGLSEAQARSDLAQAGFDAQVVEQEDALASPGVVLAQSPQPGSQLSRGSIVTITVAVAPPVPTIAPEPTIEPIPTEEPVQPTVDPLEPTDIPVPIETAAP